MPAVKLFPERQKQLVEPLDRRQEDFEPQDAVQSLERLNAFAMTALDQRCSCFAGALVARLTLTLPLVLDYPLQLPPGNPGQFTCRLVSDDELLISLERQDLSILTLNGFSVRRRLPAEILINQIIIHRGI